MLKTIKHYTKQDDPLKSQGGLGNDKKKFNWNTDQAPGWASQVAGGISSIGSSISSQTNTTGNQTALGIRNGLTDAAINSGNPYAMAAGVAMKVMDTIGDATGLHLDDVDKDAASKAGVSGGEMFLNNAMQALPGMTLFTGLMAGEATKQANDANVYGESVFDSFGSVKDRIETAKKLSGKKTIFGVGRDKMNSYIDEANRQAEVINEIGRVNTLAKLSTYDRDLAQQNLNRYAGTTYQMHAVGRNGMKILSRQELQAILATRKLQKGGVIGIDTNFIPEGSLHARLNHLQDVNPDLEDTTKKGIPVLAEGGDQVAEIEVGELILNKSLTEKIEQLAKDGSNEAMIECGKLLVDEILLNTQDNTGQILNTEEDVKGSR